MANWSDTFIGITTKNETAAEFLYQLFTNIKNETPSGNDDFDSYNTFAIEDVIRTGTTSLSIHGESRWGLNVDSYAHLLEVFTERYEIVDMEPGSDFFTRVTENSTTEGMYNGIEHYQFDPDYVRSNLLDYVSKVSKDKEERVDDHDDTILELVEKHNEFAKDRLVEIHIQELKEKLT